MLQPSVLVSNSRRRESAAVLFCLLCWFVCNTAHLGTMFIFTSAKEVMFLPDFVCLFVCLSVSKITQKVMDGSF